jgi:hypothetical protein
MSSRRRFISPAVEKVIAGIEDPRCDARYPNRTHFIDADNPEQAMLTSRALFSGDPVVVVQRDGSEALMTPERTRGLAALLLLLTALLWIKLRERPTDRKLIQLPPRTRVEVRDAAGLPRAA